MPRRFNRAVRAAQIGGAAVAIIVLAILFVPHGSGGQTRPGPTWNSRT